MKPRLGSIMFFIAITAQASDLYAVLDQQNIFATNTSLAVAYNRSGAQTLTCGIEGILSRVDVKVTKGTATTDDLVMSLWSTASDGSLLNKLSTSSLPSSSISSSLYGTVVSFDAFSLPVIPGEVIGIRLDSAAPNVPPYNARYTWFYESRGHYGAGRLFFYGGISMDQAAADFYFQTFVTPIPEPGITLLLPFAVALWIQHHRNRCQ